MGYVLPVRPYQYTDYQRRMRIDSRDPMHIEKSFPVVFASQYYDIAKEYTNSGQNIIDVKGKGEKPALSKDKIYAQLTGKGRNFNDMV